MASKYQRLSKEKRKANGLPVHLSLSPQRIHEDAWYYEEKGKLHVVVWAKTERAMSRGEAICVQVRIPWRRIEATRKRMRAELGKTGDSK